MITTQRQLQRALQKKEDSLKDKDLFFSKAYAEMLEHMQHGIIKSANPGTISMKDLGGDTLAFTDDKETTINYSSKQVKDMPRKLKHWFYLGLSLHEFGHKILTDFKLKKSSEENLAGGTLYPIPKENPYYAETLKALSEHKKNAPLQTIYAKLDNVIEDGFVDRAITALCPGYGQCLQFVNDVDTLKIPSLDEEKSTVSEEYDRLTDLIFYYCVHDTVIYSEKPENDEVIDAFEELLPTLNSAVYEANTLKRQKAINEAFCYVYHFIKEQAEKKNPPKENPSAENNESKPEEKNKENSSNKPEEKEKENPESKESSKESPEKDSPEEKTPSNGSAGNNSSSSTEENPKANGTENPKSLEEMLNEMAKGMKNSEKSSHSSSGSPSSEVQNEVANAISESSKEEKSESKETSSSGSSSEAAAQQLNAAIKATAMSQVAEDQEGQIKAELKDTGRVPSSVPIHKNYHTQIKRGMYSERAKREYDLNHEELNTIVRRFMKEFQKEIKERQLGDNLTGLYNGKRLDTAHLYREDKRIFSMKRLPEDVPNMAVGILIDCSGSMWGEKLDVAKKCAYITYNFCKQLEIPVFVIGHDASGSNIRLNSVADENSIDDNDKYRIFDLEANSSNRDGYALRFCLAKLEKMDALDKLMLVISDGRPAHDGYGYIEGQKDCQDAVHCSIKKGITTVTAGLGSDAPNIRGVYQEGRSKNDCAAFLDISEIEKMPKAFVKIIKERILSA